MRDLIVTALVFGSLPFILKRPWFGIIVWTWLGFMNPHKQCWGFAREMPFAYIVALTTLFALLISREPKRIPWTRESITLLLFVVWMTVTTLFAIFPPFAWLQLEKVVKIQLMIFVAMMVITDRARLHLLVWTIAISVGFYGVKGGIFTIVHGGVHRVQGPAGSFFAGNNETGLALAMTVPLMYYLFRESKRFYVRWGLVAAMLLTSLAALGTHSRGAVLGMGAMGAMLWWKSRNKALMAVLLVASVAAVFALMPQEWFDRMSTIKTYENELSAKSRFDSWEFALGVAASRLVGGGFEVFAGRSDAHSIYFEVLGEHGFLGLGLFLALGVFTWMSASRIRRVTEEVPDMVWMGTLSRMVQVSLVAYASAGAFLGMAYFDYVYNLVLMVVVCRAILAARQPGHQPATTPWRPRRAVAAAAPEPQSPGTARAGVSERFG
jgi:probable O-glycosylation ligase (exosortase A-associated)